MLTPERSIQIQRSIGADIMMQVSKNIGIRLRRGENVSNKSWTVCLLLELLFVQLDDVVDSRHEDKDRFEEARHRTVRWLDRWAVLTSLNISSGLWTEFVYKVSLCSPSTWPAKPVPNCAGRTRGGEEEGLCWPSGTLLVCFVFVWYGLFDCLFVGLLVFFVCWSGGTFLFQCSNIPWLPSAQ